MLSADRIHQFPLSETRVFGRAPDRQFSTLVASQGSFELPTSDGVLEQPPYHGRPVQRFLPRHTLKIGHKVLFEPEIHLFRLHQIPPKSACSIAKTTSALTPVTTARRLTSSSASPPSMRPDRYPRTGSSIVGIGVTPRAFATRDARPSSTTHLPTARAIAST